MTCTKEQLARAFTIVMLERTPDLDDVPDHVFSARFEKKMEKLIAKEAAHPWSSRHPAAKPLIAAAVVILLLFALSISVGAVRDPIVHFFLRHFKDHAEVVFETPQKTTIEQEYELTLIPEGFQLVQRNVTDFGISSTYENDNGGFLIFEQSLPGVSEGTTFDNERARLYTEMIDGRAVFVSEEPGVCIDLAWDDDYLFWIILKQEGVTPDDAIALYRSVRPVP